MEASSTPCFACSKHRPAVAYARLTNDRMIGLCNRCAHSRALRRGFIAACLAVRKAATCHSAGQLMASAE